MIRIYALTVLTLCLSTAVFGQQYELTRALPPVTIQSQLLDFGFAGGLNAPQLSAVDLNLDGTDDLYIFDRAGDVQLTFINQGSDQEVDYVFDASYARYFPDTLQEWVLLRDFDGDELMDIFTYNSYIASGIQVWRGVEIDGRLGFEPFDFGREPNIIYIPLSSGGQTQLFVSGIDYPAVDDVDCDGDLDILTFNIVGGYLEYYQNMSVELGHGRDSLLFELESSCWGGFYETSITPELRLESTPGVCWDSLVGTVVSPNHAGSTVLTYDDNGDGLKDLILGDISFPTINRSINTGTCDLAHITQQDPMFPAYDVPVSMQIFPASFYLDVNNDAKRDLVVAPNIGRNVEDRTVWWYSNVGSDDTPVFELETETFLVEDMIDMGSRAYPVALDYNADGLLDLLVGNGSLFQPVSTGDIFLHLYENTGTASAPAFTLVDDDYLGMSQFSNNTFNLAPALGDLDGDGDDDLLIGEQNGQLFYAENTAGPANPVAFTDPVYGYQGIDVGLTSTPVIVDLDRDGRLDLVIGERSGNINFFRNEGSVTNPDFVGDPDAGNNTSFLGQIDLRCVGVVTGYSAPHVFDFGDRFEIIAGGECGPLERYLVDENDLTAEFDTLDTDVSSLREGVRTSPHAADWDNDGFYEFIVGNARGGLGYFNSPLTLSGVVGTREEANAVTLIDLFPNPTQGALTVQSLDASVDEYILYNAIGQTVTTGSPSANVFQLSLYSLPEGVYFLQVSTDKGQTVKRLVKQ